MWKALPTSLRQRLPPHGHVNPAEPVYQLTHAEYSMVTKPGFYVVPHDKVDIAPEDLLDRRWSQMLLCRQQIGVRAVQIAELVSHLPPPLPQSPLQGYQAPHRWTVALDRFTTMHRVLNGCWLLRAEYSAAPHALALLVPGAGLEPARPCGHYTLNVARLPIPPAGHKRRGWDSNPRWGGDPTAVFETARFSHSRTSPALQNYRSCSVRLATSVVPLMVGRGCRGSPRRGTPNWAGKLLPSGTGKA